MTGVNPNHLKLENAIVCKEYYHIFLRKISFNSKIHLSPVSAQSKQNSQGDKSYKERIDTYKSLIHTIVTSKSTTAQFLYVT